MIELRRLALGDPDLGEVAERLSSPEWEGSIDNFSEASLARFLEDESRIYLLAYMDGEIAGAAHAYLLLHPAGPRYLYIDEVDTLPRYQRRGVGSALMNEMLRFATAYSADEAWLGADEGNDPAFALYRKLKPHEEERCTIFTFRPGA